MNWLRIGLFGFFINLALASAGLTAKNTHQPMPNQCFSDPKLAYQFLLEQKANPKHLPININTASQADFLTLEGVGVKSAEAIVLYRKEIGRFSSVDELLKVKGIGQKTLDKNRHRLTVE